MSEERFRGPINTRYTQIKLWTKKQTNNCIPLFSLVILLEPASLWLRQDRLPNEQLHPHLHVQGMKIIRFQV